MNKDKINSKIEDLEAELQELKKLANEPEQRTPEAGDVWDIDGHTGSPTLVTTSGYAHLSNGVCYNAHDAYDDLLKRKGAYLGKFNEVYVNHAKFIADVRAALSHEDYGGDSILNGCSACGVGHTGVGKSRKALRKLNIITD